MLSKIALLVLSCIAEKPLNPYQIKKLFVQLKTDRWFPMATSSIYATIKALVKQVYIEGTKARSGNMPEKTIYAITPQGQKALQESLLTALREREQFLSEFELALLFLCHLPREQALDALQTHKNSVERELAARAQMSTRLEENVPALGLISIRHSIYKREAELKTLTELIQHIETTPAWHHFLVSDLVGQE
jgi:DNA-binding PadR family transcriptional regulator